MTISCIAILQYDEDGICVYIPDMPMCNTCGYSYEEAVQMAKEVLELGLHGMRISDLPEFRHRADFVLSPQQEAVGITVEMNVENGMLISPEVILL